jgi:hypothetical protein
LRCSDWVRYITAPHTTVDPLTHHLVGEPERVASGIHALDDFCVDEIAGVAYLTTHIDNTIVCVPLDPAAPDRRSSVVVVGEPFTEELVGPSSAMWGRGPREYGRVAYVATDGGETLPPPDGIIRPSQVLRIEFSADD